MRHTSLETEWRIFAILMLGIAALLGYLSNTGQSGSFIYDALMRAGTRQQTNEIVIIAIDDRSIATMGRWPWPRSTHARLLDILTKAGASVVGLDVLLFEPGRQSAELADDVLLAAALARNGRTVLPMVLEHGTPVSRAALPLPMLANAAVRLGHTHFAFDQDGLLRHIHLYEESSSGVYSQFALAMHEVANALSSAEATRNEPLRHSENTAWRQMYQMNIPFAGPPGYFRTVSYQDVLSGRIDPTFFAGKYVLVGATATGLATIMPTPLTIGYKGMAGVEVNANILAALIEGAAIENAAGWQTALFGLLFTLLSLLACRYQSPLRALLCTVMLAIGVLLVTFIAFRKGTWLPPGTTIAMVMVVYPLWNWRRLEAALAFLSEEFAHLNRRTAIMFGSEPLLLYSRDTDFFDRRIAEMRVAARHARDMQQFIADSLDSVPDVTFVLSPQGEVLMCNRAAKNYLQITTEAHPPVISLETAFSRITMSRSRHGQPMRWSELLLSDSMVEIEAQGVDGKEFLMKSAVSKGSDGKTLGWIVSLVDVTSLRTAERHRDETLHFISHDMRAPQSSILALLELQKNPQTAFTTEEFYARVEKSVQSTLTLADDFVHLAKAKSATYHLRDADIQSILADAVDDMWAFARSRGIKVTVDVQVGDDWVCVDRPLMVRALGNLLSNAIKFSPPGSEVRCGARTVHYGDRNYIECSVVDEGDGIPEAMQELIFSPFPRREKSDREGVGLGLAFVKMVVVRHGGTISCESRAGSGSTFTFTIPCVMDSLVLATMNHAVGEINTGVQ